MIKAIDLSLESLMETGLDEAYDVFNSEPSDFDSVQDARLGMIVGVATGESAFLFARMTLEHASLVLSTEGTVGEWVKKTFTTIGEGLEKIWNSIKTFFRKLWSWLTGKGWNDPKHMSIAQKAQLLLAAPLDRTSESFISREDKGINGIHYPRKSVVDNLIDRSDEIFALTESTPRVAIENQAAKIRQIYVDLNLTMEKIKSDLGMFKPAIDDDERLANYVESLSQEEQLLRHQVKIEIVKRMAKEMSRAEIKKNIEDSIQVVKDGILKSIEETIEGGDILVKNIVALCKEIATRIKGDTNSKGLHALGSVLHSLSRSVSTFVHSGLSYLAGAGHNINKAYKYIEINDDHDGGPLAA